MNRRNELRAEHFPEGMILRPGDQNRFQRLIGAKSDAQRGYDDAISLIASNPSDEKIREMVEAYESASAFDFTNYDRYWGAVVFAWLDERPPLDPPLDPLDIRA